MFRVRFAPLLIIILFAAACAPKVQTYEKPASRAFGDTAGTPLGRASRSLGDPGDGRSGLRLVPDGTEALALRLALSDAAVRSIDAQYYLLHNDVAGHLFAWHLVQAADRGVRVRLLLDDMDTQGYDAMTAALDRHPKIEIRLFNPFRNRRSKALEALTDFGRINRRMHNKSMTFDNQVTIVGGRNIGAEYFSAREDSNYDDLDVLAAGPIVRDVSQSFDSYWNSPYAVPASAVIDGAGQQFTVAEARARLAQLARAGEGSPYGAALTHEIRSRVRRGQLTLDWVPARLAADPPEKAAGDAPEDAFLAAAMLPYLQRAQDEVLIVSAYFVPRAKGTEFLTGLEQRGVDVTVLTNSIDSTDVAPVHGHYAYSRKDLLAAGVDLWELRADKDRPDRARAGLGQSLSGLHAKAFAIDNRYLFIGSFNWDPRSVRINTEMGILIDSPKMARQAVSRLRQNLPVNAYHLRLGEDGRIQWLEQRGGTAVLYRQEPSESAWNSFMTGIYGLLPIGGLL